MVTMKMSMLKYPVIHHVLCSSGVNLSDPLIASWVWPPMIR